ncbi:MAG: methyltransferase family protein [Chitinophagaceae bacterium]
MNTQHWLLLILWILYGVVHSFLANVIVKQSIQKNMGKLFRYYRICYSLFAFVTLMLLLWYQFSMRSIWLYSLAIIRYGVSLIFIVPGIIIMVKCIRKYFFDLSGIQSFQKDKPAFNSTLQQTGLHKYVRHPLYFGTLLFVWGLFLLFPLLSNLIAAVTLSVYVVIGIQLEETKLFLEYGEEYKRYSKRVPKLIPKF